jgi:hypothetical protein
MRRDHAEVLQRTHAWRAESATRLQLKVASALEAKLDDVLGSDEKMSKTSVRALALCYGITVDKERAIHDEPPVPEQRSKMMQWMRSQRPRPSSRAGPKWNSLPVAPWLRDF